MNHADLQRTAIALPKGALYRIHDGAGQRIEALSGCLWITIDHDLRDIVVEAGAGFSIDRDGDMLVSALDDSRFALLEPVTPRHAA
jgi:hypothetical protein